MAILVADSCSYANVLTIPGRIDLQPCAGTAKEKSSREGATGKDLGECHNDGDSVVASDIVR